METLIFEKTSEVKKNSRELESKLKVKITVQGKKVSFEGQSLDEYEASRILEAINFGFSAKKALILLDQDMQFRRVNIKGFTRRKNLEDVRARIIGTEGQVKRTIESLSDCYLAIQGNTIGVIAHADEIEEIITALHNLVRGSKQANVYRFLEEMNRYRKLSGKDLGLKIEKSSKLNKK